METVREKAINLIKDLPSDISLEEIIEQLKFIDSVNKGLGDLHSNNVVSNDEIKKVLKRWLK
jgi:translation initiation factor 2B subunit (eIF-2B alpha/beta/delta family)